MHGTCKMCTHVYIHTPVRSVVVLLRLGEAKPQFFHENCSNSTCSRGFQTFCFRTLLRSLFFFWPRCAACGILVPRSGIGPRTPALGVWSLNHWTTREVPPFTVLKVIEIPQRSLAFLWVISTNIIY